VTQRSSTAQLFQCDCIRIHGMPLCTGGGCPNAEPLKRGDTRNGPPRFDLWPDAGCFETEPKRRSAKTKL